MKFKILYIFAFCAVLLFAASCTGGYSFTGADISANIKTITIDYFQNRASMVQPTLSNVLTESLKDKFTSQTNLELVNNNSDLLLEGEITNYTVTPQSFQGNETAALNRLTITIKVKYTNSVEPLKSFDTNFTRYADFESSQNLASVESDLIQQIVEQLTEDIFIKAVANW
jgi:hypothetical protein